MFLGSGKPEAPVYTKELNNNTFYFFVNNFNKQSFLNRTVVCVNLKIATGCA